MELQGRSRGSVSQARHEQRIHTLVSAQHAMYAARYQRVVNAIRMVQADIQGMGARASQAPSQRARGELRDVESEIEQLHASWLSLLKVIEDLNYLQELIRMGRGGRLVDQISDRVKEAVDKGPIAEIRD